MVPAAAWSSVSIHRRHSGHTSDSSLPVLSTLKKDTVRETNTALSRDGKITLENGSVLTWGSAKWSIMAFPSTNRVKLNELKEKSVFRKKLPIFVCLRESCLPSVHSISLHVYS